MQQGGENNCLSENWAKLSLHITTVPTSNIPVAVLDPHRNRLRPACQYNCFSAVKARRRTFKELTSIIYLHEQNHDTSHKLTVQENVFREACQ